MERLTISEQTQTAMDDFKSTYPQFDPNGLIYAGSNLIVDDHLEIAASWKGVVLGGEGGAVWFCVPDWGDVIMPIDLVAYITDRAGPDGQTMPVFDEQELQARSAAQASAQNPKHAAKDARHDARAHRRDLKELLRDALQRLPHQEQKHAREVLRAKGVLGKEEKE